MCKRDKISHLLSSPQLLSLLRLNPSKEGFKFNEIKTSGQMRDSCIPWQRKLKLWPLFWVLVNAKGT